MALILLGADNKVLQEGIQQKMAAAKKEPCETKLYDFDNVSYQVTIDKDDRSRMAVSLQCQNWNVYQSQGSEEWIKQKLGEYVKTFTADGVDFEIPLDEKSAEKAEAVGKTFSKLRAYALGGPLHHYCKALAEKKPLKDVFYVKFRNDTHMWICPSNDRVTIVYTFEFPIRSDRVIAKQILTEFTEVRRQREFSNTPLVSYSEREPPLELKNAKLPTYDKAAFLGYFSISLLQEHIKEGKLENSVENVVGFRAYLTYHIKCAKAYFHSRMRARGKVMLQILNRARYEPDEDRKKKKIIVGAD